MWRILRTRSQFMCRRCCCDTRHGHQHIAPRDELKGTDISLDFTMHTNFNCLHTFSILSPDLTGYACGKNKNKTTLSSSGYCRFFDQIQIILGRRFVHDEETKRKKIASSGARTTCFDVHICIFLCVMPLRCCPKQIFNRVPLSNFLHRLSRKWIFTLGHNLFAKTRRHKRIGAFKLNFHMKRFFI